VLIRPLRSLASAVALFVLALAAVQGCTAAPGKPAPSRTPPASATGPRVTPVTDISAGCAGNSSEVDEAFAPPDYVYAEWIGCGGIGFARSADSGQHFGAAGTVPGSRGFSWDPAITVAADGTVYAAFMHSGGQSDVLFDAHPTDPGTDAVHPGYEYFTSSADGTHWPSAPRPLWPGQGSLSLSAWWIDGDISADAAGDLYATWDTQTAAGDIGWLTYSRDGGRTWSAPLRVTPDRDQAPHIVESAGGTPGQAYIAWQTSGTGPGYATYLRPFSIQRGWLGPAVKVSGAYGDVRIWPGDTFGIARLPDGSVSMTWGSAVGASKASAIYAAVVTPLRLSEARRGSAWARSSGSWGGPRTGSAGTRTNWHGPIRSAAGSTGAAMPGRRLVRWGDDPTPRTGGCSAASG
jgi:hypothetical protein